MNFKWIISAILSLLLVVLLFSFTRSNKVDLIEAELTENLTPEVIEEHFDYELYHLTNYQSKKEVNMSQFAKKLLLINFYEPWCKACNKEFPLLDAFAKQHKNQVQVISISSGDDMEMLNTWHDKWKYPNITFYLDKTNKLTQNFRIKSIPATYLVEADGRIKYKFIGDRDYTSPAFLNYIKHLLQ